MAALGFHSFSFRSFLSSWYQTLLCLKGIKKFLLLTILAVLRSCLFLRSFNSKRVLFRSFLVPNIALAPGASILGQDRRLIGKDIAHFLLTVLGMDKRADSSVENRPGKGSKNKRKLAHSSILPNPDNISSSLIEFLGFELSADISQSTKAEFTSSEVGSDRSREEPEVHINELADWPDPIAISLEELLLANLKALFLSAVKQIIELGYRRDLAEKALSRKGLYIEEGDPVSNIVNETMKILKGEDVNATDVVFENFQHLLHYTMVEMINVLCEVRPSLTVGEAMWLLLIFDLNISQACAAEEDHLSSSVSRGESCASCCINPQSKSKIQSSDVSTCITPNIQKDSSSSHQNNMSEAPKFESFPDSSNNRSSLASGVKLEAEKALLPYTSRKSSGTSREYAQAASQLAASEGKSGHLRKRHGKKELAALRNKFLYMEKTCRAFGKGGLKSGKLTNIGDFVEKKLKIPSEIQDMKGGSSNTISNDVNTTSALPAGDSSRTLPTKDAINTVVDTKNLTSGKRSTPTFELNPSDFQKVLDYLGIPYDKSADKYFPRDEKDKFLLMLIMWMHKLKDEETCLNNWAHQKIMQATQTLTRHHAELSILRKEKQEAELCIKEKKNLEDNAMKRISEMEKAVANATSQTEGALSAAHKLEVDNSVLKEELGAAKLSAVQTMTRYLQALGTEETARKKVQSCESEKGLLFHELERQKQTLANLQQEVDKEKSLQVKVESRMEEERAVKEKLLAQAASIRKEREQLEARAKVEEDMIIKKAASDEQKYVEDIVKLEKELAELKLKSESEKIAALRRGIDGRNDSCAKDDKTTPTRKEKRKSDVSQVLESFQGGSLRRERECVMCLSEEMSVVFLPCAHQVVCGKCSKLHEQQGMKDCPSCRTPIQRRIHVRFVGE